MNEANTRVENAEKDLALKKSAAEAAQEAADKANAAKNKAWGEYLNSDGVVSEDPESKAKGTFEAVMGKLSASRFKSAFPSGATKSSSGMSCGLVVQHVKDSAIVSISFRATKLPGALLSMPMFYTEVRFQGLPE